MEQPPDVSKISALYALLASLSAALVSIGMFKAKVATKEGLAESETRQEALLRKSLYRGDGTSVYVPRAECDKTQTGCSARIIAKLDEMKAESQRRHEEYLEAQRDHLRMHDGLPEFVGQVKQFMHHRAGD